MPGGTWPNATNCWYEVLLAKESFIRQCLWIPLLCFYFAVISAVHFNVNKTELGSELLSLADSECSLSVCEKALKR